MGYGINTGRATGTTTAAYVVALTWVCEGLKKKTIHLFNTHATLSMFYKLTGTYNDSQTAGKEDVLVAAESLAAGEDARLQYSGQYDKLILSVIDNSGHATYEINYSGKAE